MKVLVAFAMDQEFRPWRRLRGFERSDALRPPRYHARFGAADVFVVLTGIGPRPARAAIQAGLSEGPDICISTGLAGGLRSRHRSGDVLVARSVLDVSGAVLEKCDTALIRAAAACGARQVEAFRSLERIVPTAAEKSRLAVSADAVEMEGFVILAEARAVQVPCVAVRIIADPCEQDLPLDFSQTLGAGGNVKVAGVLAQLARNPMRIPAVARLGQQTQRAAARLAIYLDRYVQALACEARPEAVSGAVA